MRSVLVAASVILGVSLAGCHDRPDLLDEGPHPMIAVDGDSIRLHSTYGNYPANWTPWGHVTLVDDRHIVQDSSDGTSSGFRIHELQANGTWRVVDSYEFGLLRDHGRFKFDQPGNYSLSDIDRGGPGAGVHVNVTALRSAQGCAASAVGLVCDYYHEPGKG